MKRRETNDLTIKYLFIFQLFFFNKEMKRLNKLILNQ